MPNRVIEVFHNGRNFRKVIDERGRTRHCEIDIHKIQIGDWRPGVPGLYQDEPKSVGAPDGTS